MKHLIVNGDDFGASAGINRGILEAHRHGILTSASLLVDLPRAREAADVAATLPDLSLGLHAAFTNEAAQPLLDFDNRIGCRAHLERQMARFVELVGAMPTHLDSHHNIHRDPRLLPLFLEAAQQHSLYMREHSSVHYFPDFYGQWNGETHLEQIDVSSVCAMLRERMSYDVVELSCHPGYFDPEFESVYHSEREAELRTLCDSVVRQSVKSSGFVLISFRDVGRPRASTDAGTGV